MTKKKKKKQKGEGVGHRVKRKTRTEQEGHTGKLQHRYFSQLQHAFVCRHAHTQGYMHKCMHPHSVSHTNTKEETDTFFKVFLAKHASFLSTKMVENTGKGLKMAMILDTKCYSQPLQIYFRDTQNSTVYGGNVICSHIQSICWYYIFLNSAANAQSHCPFKGEKKKK